MNPSNIASSSRSSIVEEYTPLNNIKDPRLDQLVGKRQGKEIKVSRDTFDMMAKAHAVMLKTAHKTFPDGPGNQKTSILTSGGRSWARLKDGRDAAPGSVTTYGAIKRYGGGLCDEYQKMARLELQQLSRSLPTLKVSDSNMNHEYLIIGDWRDKRSGDKAIVLDAWQGINKIHTYGERINTVAPYVKETLPEGDPIPLSPDIQEAMQVETISNEEMEYSLKYRLGLRSGPEAAEKILATLSDAGNLWDSVTSAKNVYNYYSDPDGNTSAFNSTSPDYIRNYLDARSELNTSAYDTSPDYIRNDLDARSEFNTAAKKASGECCTIM